MIYDVFICYRGEGKSGEFANWLYNELDKLEYLEVFFAPRTICHGQDFLKSINAALKTVHVVILILSKNFFEKCHLEDDIVKYEIKTAALNPYTVFLPIMFKDFNYCEENLTCFTIEEINRFKYQSAIQYNGVYDLLFEMEIKNELLMLFENGQSIEDIKTRNKKLYIGANKEEEKKFLRKQTEMLFEYDNVIYKEIKHSKQVILDLGCNDGSNIMAHFGNVKEVRIVGIDQDPDCIQYANNYFGNDNMKFYCYDCEDNKFNSYLGSIEKELHIDKFDLVNLSMFLLHIEDPYRLLKILRSHLSKNGVLFIRDIDDDFNIIYPDSDKMFRKMVEISSYCDILGYRQRGKEIYTYLKRCGYSQVKIEKIGYDTSEMDYFAREALFNTYFGYIPVALEKTIERYSNNLRIQKDYKWVCKNINEANQRFHQNDFLFSVGYIVYTARI